MSENQEKFLVSDGNGVKEVPVELKDHSKDPKLTDEKFKELAAEEDKIPGGLSVAGDLRKRTDLEKEVDAEIIAKGKDAVHDFDESQAIVVPAKKRGRPAKKVAAEVKPEKIWYCSTCRETISDKNVMKIGAGPNRWAVFCPQCQRSFGFQDEAVVKIVEKLIKDNPTGKNEKA